MIEQQVHSLKRMLLWNEGMIIRTSTVVINDKATYLWWIIDERQRIQFKSYIMHNVDECVKYANPKVMHVHCFNMHKQWQTRRVTVLVAANTQNMHCVAGITMYPFVKAGKQIHETC